MVWEITRGQNMRPNRLSHIYIYKSSMNTVLFANTTIGIPENLFLVCKIVGSKQTFTCLGRKYKLFLTFPCVRGLLFMTSYQIMPDN